MHDSYLFIYLLTYLIYDWKQTLNGDTADTVRWLAGWCLMALSAQKGYIVPCEKYKFVNDIYLR